MEGAHCTLYKTCIICKENMWYSAFQSLGRKGSRRHKSYCRACEDLKNKKISQPPYSYDTSLLKHLNIEVRVWVHPKKRIRYHIPRERAVSMIDGGVAGIVHEGLIHKFYNNKTIRQMILERDQHTCQYCNQYGDTLDHIIPRSKGGVTSFLNCVCACEPCNKLKRNDSVEEFVKQHRNSDKV